MTDVSFIRETTASPATLSAASVGDFVQLMKPRVMSLVVFTALVGLMLAPGAIHPGIAAIAILAIAVGGGASGVLNQWYEAKTDALMTRTAARPIPSGRVMPEEAFAFGSVLAVASVVVLGLATNWFAAAFLAFTIFFYVVVYTIWLKPRTPQNIVIGGAAGAFPPMIGWAVATGGIGPESVLMFTVILLWTPPHFWALSLFTQDDYARAGVPMLPLVAGERSTRRQILGYALALAVASVALAFTEAGGPVTLAVGLGVNALFLMHCVRLARRGAGQAQGDRYAAEKKAFGVSILYLFALFGAVAADSVVPTPAFWPMLF
jgi:protoheme IX farnesyltransferase